MTQYDTGGGDFVAYEEEPRPRMSTLAIASLVCALIFCIPVLPPLGLLLGFIALVTMVGKKMVRGRGLAIAAIVLGFCFSLGWGIFGYFAYNLYRQVEVLMREEPPKALTAGFAGDYATMRASFQGRPNQATDDDAKAFVDELRTRYGTFDSIAIDDQGAPPQATGKPVIEVPYVAKFKGPDDTMTSVKMGIELVIIDEKTGSWVMKIGMIEVEDAQRGAMRFPPLAAATKPAATGGGGATTKPN